MKKALFILFGVLLSVTAFSQAITGGSGVCYGNADPNTITSIQDPADAVTCHIFIDRTADKVYVYNITTTTWVEWTQTGATNLAIGTQTATTLEVTSSTGTNVTLPAATTTEAGLMTDVQFDKLSFISVTQAVDLDDMESDIADLRTLTGTADAATDLGTFTGTTIADASTIKAALQSLETALELLPTSDTHFFSEDKTQLAARSHTLLDNTATVYQYGSTGATGIFSITTTDGSESVDLGYDFTVDGDVTLGNAAGDVVTIYSAAITAPNIPAYASKTAADAALGAGVVWKTSVPNVHGLPADMLFVAN